MSDEPRRNRRPYEAPQLFRVELQHEQAILSSCSQAASGNVANNPRYCRPPRFPFLPGCRKAGAAIFSDSTASS